MTKRHKSLAGMSVTCCMLGFVFGYMLSLIIHF